MADKARVNLYMPKELKDYLVAEGEKMGFNLTTMILIACMDYRKTQQSIALGQIMETLTDEDKLKEFAMACKSAAEK